MFRALIKKDVKYKIEDLLKIYNNCNTNELKKIFLFSLTSLTSLDNQTKTDILKSKKFVDVEKYLVKVCCPDHNQKLILENFDYNKQYCDICG